MRSSILLHPNYLQLLLPSSKTKTFCASNIIAIAAAFDKTYIVSLIKNFFTWFPHPHNSLLFDLSQTTPFTWQLVTKILRSYLRTLYYTGNYSSHSFHQGRVTSAWEKGFTDEELQLFKCWKSDSYKLYIDMSIVYILNVSKWHQR